MEKQSERGNKRQKLKGVGDWEGDAERGIMSLPRTYNAEEGDGLRRRSVPPPPPPPPPRAERTRRGTNDLGGGSPSPLLLSLPVSGSDAGSSSCRSHLSPGEIRRGRTHGGGSTRVVVAFHATLLHCKCLRLLVIVWRLEKRMGRGTLHRALSCPSLPKIV